MNPLLAPELRALKNMQMKPNYSALSRKYGMDRHTIKAMYDRLDSPPPERKAKPSCLDAVREEAAMWRSFSTSSRPLSLPKLKNRPRRATSHTSFERTVLINLSWWTVRDSNPRPAD